MEALIISKITEGSLNFDNICNMPYPLFERTKLILKPTVDKMTERKNEQ